MGELSAEQGFFFTLALYQAICLIFFAIHFDTSDLENSGTVTGAQVTERVYGSYAMYMDIHVMVFVGFGFLLTYLRKYSLSAVGVNLVVAAMSIQWAIVCVTMAHQIGDNDYPQKMIDVPTLISADYGTAAVLISVGAVLGRVTPTQLLWMSFLELIFYSINEYIIIELFEVVDAGGSIVIHTFGAFFGLAVTLQIGKPSENEQVHNTSRYTSDIFSMVGTLFMWMYWPSFNAAMVPTDGFRKERAVVNTILSIVASCGTAYAFTRLVTPSGKFDMVYIRNATLAGGVAMGASGQLAINPSIALAYGILAGLLSVLSYRVLTPALDHACKISDTAGVVSSFGLPGLFGGIIGGFVTMAVSDNRYGSTLTDIYEKRPGRSAPGQGWYQILATAVSVGIAIASGIVIGGFLASSFFRQPQTLYDDDELFQIAEEGGSATSPLELQTKSTRGTVRSPDSGFVSIRNQ